MGPSTTSTYPKPRGCKSATTALNTSCAVVERPDHRCGDDVVEVMDIILNEIFQVPCYFGKEVMGFILALHYCVPSVRVMCFRLWLFRDFAFPPEHPPSDSDVMTIIAVDSQLKKELPQKSTSRKRLVLRPFVWHNCSAVCEQ